MERTKIIHQIEDIEREHCQPCDLVTDHASVDLCMACEHGKRLKGLGDDLMNLTQSRTEQILAKGQDMKRSEIEWLLQRGVSEREIIKTLKIGYKKYKAYMEGVRV